MRDSLWSNLLPTDITELSTFLSSAAVIYVVLTVLKHTLGKVSLWRRFRLAKKLHGCESPVHYPHKLPFGYDLILLRKKAVEEGRYNPLFQEHFGKYGPIWKENQLGVPTINSIDPSNRHAVLSTSFDDYGPPPGRRAAMLPLFGRGIFFESGPRWKHSRALITPIFSLAELSDLGMFEKHVERFLDQIPRDGSTIDLQVLLDKLFLDSTTEFLLGQSVDSLSEKPVSGAEEFLAAFQRGLVGAGRRGNLAIGRANFWFWFDKQWPKDIASVHAFVDRYVGRALNQIPKGEKPSDPTESQQSQPRTKYVLINEMARHIRDPVELRSEVMNVFLPSRESSAIALSNAIFHLARNPSIWGELRGEALALGDQPLTYDLLKKRDMFRYTLYEGIRLQGPSGRISRHALRDTILPRGGGPDGKSPVFVPKGTMVQLNSYPVFRDKRIWGEDADSFRPSRFVGKERDLITAGFRPFLEGPRSCPARQQVLTQGVYLLVKLAREFESIENRDPCLEYVEMIRVLCESRNGVRVALLPAV